MTKTSKNKIPYLYPRRLGCTPTPRMLFLLVFVLLITQTAHAAVPTFDVGLNPKMSLLVCMIANIHQKEFGPPPPGALAECKQASGGGGGFLGVIGQVLGLGQGLGKVLGDVFGGLGNVFGTSGSPITGGDLAAIDNWMEIADNEFTTPEDFATAEKLHDLLGDEGFLSTDDELVFDQYLEELNKNASGQGPAPSPELTNQIKGMAGNALGVLSGLVDGTKIFGPCDSLDCIAWKISKAMLASFSQQVINWIKTGNLQGTPLFVLDWERFLIDAADQASGLFIEELKVTDLCKPFAPRIRTLLGGASSRRPFFERARCTISDVLRNVENFYLDFADGGWLRWMEITTIPQNNFFGAYYISLEHQLFRQASAVEAARNEARASNGFLGVPKCTKQKIVVPAEDPEQGSQEVEYEDCITVTPGKTVEEELANVFGEEIRTLGLADELDEVLAVLLQRLLHNALFGLQGIFTGGPSPLDLGRIPPPPAPAPPPSAPQGAPGGTLGADLRSTINTLPQISAGTSFNFKGIVNNDGSVSTLPYTGNFQLDQGSDGTFETALGGFSGPAKPPGSGDVLISGGWTAIAGTHTIKLCADVDNQGETNTANNCNTRTFTVNP